MTKSPAARFERTLTKRLLRAIRLRKNAEAKWLLTHDTCKPVQVSAWGTLLHDAARCGNEEIVHHLIHLGWEIDSFHDHRTPLMLAVETKSQATVEVLLAANANIDVVDDEEEFSAFEKVFSISNFHPGVGREFLRHVRRVTSTNDEYVEKLAAARCTPYHAVHFGDVELMKFLLAMKHRVDIYGYRMRTALHAAVEIEDVGLVEWLIDNRVDVDAMDNEGLTPLHYLYKRDGDVQRERERLAILEILLDRNADLSYPQVSPIVRYGSADAIHSLSKRGVDFNAQIGSNGESLLHVLAENDRPGVGEGIGDLNVNACDRRNVRPLFVAATNRNPSMLKFLLARGADPNAWEEYNNPLVGTFVAALLTRESQERLNECAWLLLRNGADPQITRADTSRIFECASMGEFDFDMIGMVVAHLAMGEMFGTPIAKHARGRINSDRRLRAYYRSCRRVLKVKIFGSVTVLDLLRETDSGMKVHLRDELFVEKMRRVGCKSQLRATYSYYYEILARRIDEIARGMRLEYEAAKALRRIFNGHHVLAQLMIGYFDKQDLELLCRNFL